VSDLRRWRMVLGSTAEDSFEDVDLTPEEKRADAALERLGIRELLLEPELLRAVEPDVRLVAQLVELAGVLPAAAREAARELVTTVVEDIQARLRPRLVAAVAGALDRSSRTRKPRPGDVDWDRTIKANLATYDPGIGTIVPEKLIGHTRRRQRGRLHDVIVCVDQSGSMSTSVVYAGVLAAALATVPSVRTSLVAFATDVADLTDQLMDPVELLFGAQLGGGTDIEQAVAYCSQLVERPTRTLLVLVTDLYEGAGDAERMLRHLAGLVHAGVTVVCLLALTDEGAPAHHDVLASRVAGLGVATFACTPDHFPELLAAAIGGDDVAAWAEREGMPTTRPAPG
jgi:uncharacterized protein with von Willebrand factor type A (vWA) domain